MNIYIYMCIYGYESDSLFGLLQRGCRCGFYFIHCVTYYKRRKRCSRLTFDCHCGFYDEQNVVAMAARYASTSASVNTSNTTNRRLPPLCARSQSRTVAAASSAAAALSYPNKPVLMQQNATELKLRAAAASSTAL